MITVRFSELKNGTQFTFAGKTYTKVETVWDKPGCCPGHNAVSDDGHSLFAPKTMVVPVETVKVQAIVVKEGQDRNDNVWPHTFLRTLDVPEQKLEHKQKDYFSWGTREDESENTDE